MPTRPIPAGTENFSVNLPVPLRRKIGRLAVSQRMATGAMVRSLIAEAVDRAERRGLELARDVRQLVLPFALCLVAVLGYAAVLFAAACGHAEPRRVHLRTNRCAIVRRVKREG